MEQVIPIRLGSFHETSSRNSSLRRSLSLSVSGHSQADEDIEDKSASEAGDIGDRALGYSLSGRSRFSIDNLGDNVVVPVEQDKAAAAAANTHLGNQKNELQKHSPFFLDHISCCIYLAVFGILGVLTRYLLENLFGPGIIGATSDTSYMYRDLGPNMVGSFLMGWFGAVFKRDISKFSDKLAIGLTTGYCGSLTTFSGWNQQMLQLSAEGHWVLALLGFLLGSFLVVGSFLYGVRTAKAFRWMLQRIRLSSRSSTFKFKGIFSSDNDMCRTILLVVLVVLLCLLWGLSGAMLKREFSSGSSESQLWLGCIVGPIGVWIRFYLARLNGRGIGSSELLKWVPIGTLTANVSAVCLMAALATVKMEVNNKSIGTVASGLQFGICGCLSTVSTFVAEIVAMFESSEPWRAEAYVLATIVISFSLGTLIYSVPYWTES